MRCSYCYSRGSHSKMHCPKMKEDAAKNPNSFAAAELKTYQEAVKNRKCSYCYTVGHNRSGCKSIKSDQQVVESLRKKFKENTKEYFQLHVPVGSIVGKHFSFPESRYINLVITKHEIAEEPRIDENWVGNTDLTEQERESFHRSRRDKAWETKESGRHTPGFWAKSLTGENLNHWSSKVQETAFYSCSDLYYDIRRERIKLIS